MRVEGTCDNCDSTGWVDSLTSLCRKCEIDGGKRWGHRTVKAEEGKQVQVDPEASIDTD